MLEANMYDWKKIIADGVPCYFWDTTKPAEPCIDYLISIDPEEEYRFHRKNCINDAYPYKFCEPIRTEDKEKYTIKEPVKIWRACKTWEEFRPFMNKIAIPKNKCSPEICRIISRVVKEYEFSAQWWFDNYTIEDGSPIGIEEAQE